MLKNDKILSFSDNFEKKKRKSFNNISFFKIETAIVLILF